MIILLEVPYDIQDNGDNGSKRENDAKSCSVESIIARVWTEGNVQTESKHTREVVILQQQPLVIYTILNCLQVTRTQTSVSVSRKFV